MKRALVTGGSGGIGAAICRRLAADGHHVIVHANRSLDKAGAVVAAIREAGGSAEAVAFDVGYSDSSFFTRLFKRKVGMTPARYRQRFGRLAREIMTGAGSSG